MPDGGLYEPLSTAVVRMPLLPVDAYPSGRRDLAADAAWADSATARTAVAVASTDLFRALANPRRPGHNASRTVSRLRRYMIRMATRPTPYGLFAGVGLVSWGSVTDLGLASDLCKTRARPDMGWLLGLVDALEADTAVRRGLRLVASRACIVRAGRLFIAAPAPNRTQSDGEGNSLRATDKVLGVMDLARSAIGHDALIASMLSHSDATVADLESVIAQLLRAGALLSDLRPPLTCPDPAAYVQKRLADVPAAAAAADALAQVLTALQDWDALPMADRCDALPRISRQMHALHAVAASSVPLQVDAALRLAGSTVQRAIASEVAGAAELLLRMSPIPQGPPYLEAYRDRFIGRYDSAREVPLLELLDPQLGLGPPDRTRVSRRAPEFLPRMRCLETLALRAQRDQRLVVEIDDELRDRLQTWAPDRDSAPLSLDLAVLVAAHSPANLDRGEFQLVISPNPGAGAAGRSTGRFAHLLGRDAIAALSEASDAEAERTNGLMCAEVVYVPGNPRSANVAIRPAIRSHEIAVGTMPGVPEGQVVPLDELVVGMREERFYVRWPARDVGLRFVQGHMLTFLHAPPVIRFLFDVAADRTVQLSEFDWGPAAAFPFLPRVTRGRVVLSPAQWRVKRGSAADALPPEPSDGFAEAVAAWQAQWSVPRHVYLTAGDNRLLLDLDDGACIELLREELCRLPEYQSLLLQEALPGLSEAWASGPSGSHLVELVVPLVLSMRHDGGSDASAKLSDRPALRHRPIEPQPPSERGKSRVNPPGSDWLYLKLYCPPAAQDDLIAGELRDYVQSVRMAGLTDGWFLVRYADPAPHLRIRFRGNPELLVEHLLPWVSRWAHGLVRGGACERFAIDTYERELERYGGEVGIVLAEAIFNSDSVAVVELLEVLRRQPQPADRLTLTIVSIDDLLSALGFDELRRLEYYAGRARLTREDGREYRARKSTLMRLFGSDGADAEQVLDPAVELVLAARRDALRPIATELEALEQAGLLEPSRAALCDSYVHMHCNRLGSDPALEALALRLLRRTREAVRAVRLGPRTSARR